MGNSLRSSFFGNQRRRWAVLLAGTVILLFGCQAPEPPRNPGIASFKQELKNCFDSLGVTLMEPVARKDVAAIRAALEKVESPAAKLCRMCPFEIGVLNPAGETLAAYPLKGDGKAQNFSTYELVKKAISSKKIQQQALFLADGSKLYLVCAPIVRQDALIGLVAIAVSSEDAQKRWGLNEKEFLAIDFNT
jgi:C4-dicarboxylate-specific signal transduction histidine kinase